MRNYITSNKEFSTDSMLTSLMINGYYCYHDEELKSLLTNNIVWKPARPNFYVGIDNVAVNTLINRQQKTFKNFFKLELVSSCISYGIEGNTSSWHCDKIENIDMQILCYQEDFTPIDGGELAILLHDRTEQFYIPKNGDVMILNHSAGVMHKVFPLTTDKKRIVVNVSYKFKTQQD